MRNTKTRNEALSQTLLARRRELHSHVRVGVRGRRADRPDQGRDQMDVSDETSQNDLALSLLQMKAESLSLAEAAIGRRRTGGYGTSISCYPFAFIGHAPERFIVRAERLPTS